MNREWIPLPARRGSRHEFARGKGRFGSYVPMMVNRERDDLAYNREVISPVLDETDLRTAIEAASGMPRCGAWASRREG